MDVDAEYSTSRMYFFSVSGLEGEAGTRSAVKGRWPPLTRTCVGPRVQRREANCFRAAMEVRGGAVREAVRRRRSASGMLGVRMVVSGRRFWRRLVIAGWGRRGEPLVETMTWVGGFC